jgi:hypothetical protein
MGGWSEWAVEDSNLWPLARHADEHRSPPFATARKRPTTWDFHPSGSVHVRSWPPAWLSTWLYGGYRAHLH